VVFGVVDGVSRKITADNPTNPVMTARAPYNSIVPGGGRSPCGCGRG